MGISVARGQKTECVCDETRQQSTLEYIQQNTPKIEETVASF